MMALKVILTTVLFIGAIRAVIWSVTSYIKGQTETAGADEVIVLAGAVGGHARHGRCGGHLGQLGVVPQLTRVCEADVVDSCVPIDTVTDRRFNYHLERQRRNWQRTTQDNCIMSNIVYWLNGFILFSLIFYFYVFLFIFKSDTPLHSCKSCKDGLIWEIIPMQTCRVYLTFGGGGVKQHCAIAVQPSELQGFEVFCLTFIYS